MGWANDLVRALCAKPKLGGDALGGFGLDLFADNDKVARFKCLGGNFFVAQLAVSKASLLVEYVEQLLLSSQ